MSATPLHRCSTCQGASESALNSSLRNLVVFIDGTSNEYGDKKTNVLKLHAEVLESTQRDSEPKQLRLYCRGIGTHDKNVSLPVRMRKEVYSRFEMGLAWNVRKNVEDAYIWLARNYQQGDRIYLFGFSRGAYQVRVLASMIHEVGLINNFENAGMAFDEYLSIHPYRPKTREKATKFKKDLCRQGVRVHFVGVWDTVSSIGFVKEDVFISASAAVTNSCHFRHALALDERRVKFMPEYFVEINAHHGNVRTRITAQSDVKEVWFAGSHSDVGGMSRPCPERVFDHPDGGDQTSCHAGNVSLQWMRQEATTHGLVLDPKSPFWDLDDVDFGREDTMTAFWKFVELLPIRHQVSFSGSGNHKRRSHWFKPRQVIPDQQIHASVLSGDVYKPRATLGDGIDIPTLVCDGLWTSELPDKVTTTNFLISVLSDQQKTTESLEKVVFLFDSWLLVDERRIVETPWPRWSETSVRGNFARIVIYYVISNLSMSDDLVEDAREALSNTLVQGERDLMKCREVLIFLRFVARHQTLRRRIVSSHVVRDAVHALEWTAQIPSETHFQLVTDTIGCFIQDDGLRGNVIDELNSGPGETGAGQTRLSLALEVKAPNHLMASLKMITSLAKCHSSRFKELEPKLAELAVKKNGPVGSAAVEALVAIKVQMAQNASFVNILNYLSNTLPRLNVDGGSGSSYAGIDSLPTILQVDGSGMLDEKIMDKLVSAIGTTRLDDKIVDKLVSAIRTTRNDVSQRTVATLTLLKLCGNSEIRKYMLDKKVVDIFMGQLARKETSLLAAYALNTCLKHDIPVESSRAAPLIFTMLNKGWFDDAVGRVGGLTIFSDLMMSDPGDLKKEVIKPRTVETLVKKLEDGDHNEVRVSLICLSILGAENPDFLKPFVNDAITYLKDRDVKIQKRGVKLLSALAKTIPGEEVIRTRVTEIVKMLRSEGPRSQLFGPAAALYDLCKNETLREQIKGNQEYIEFRGARAQRRAATA